MGCAVDDVVGLDRRGPVAIVTIRRPERMNALNREVFVRLGLFFRRVTEGFWSDVVESPRCIILTGAGDRAFSTGADLREILETYRSEAGLTGVKEIVETGRRALRAVEECPVPVIAAIKGYALGGGCELALACDVRVAAKGSKIGLTEVLLDIPPGLGGTVRLSRLVGAARAEELIFTGRILDADEASAIGLVNSTSDPDMLLSHCMRIAEDFAKAGAIGVAYAKSSMKAWLGEPYVQREFERELEAFLKAFEKGGAEKRIERLLS